MESYRILHLLPYLPSPVHFGGALRIHHILRHFADRHHVRVVAFADHGDPEAFLRDFPELKGRCELLTRPAWRRRSRLSQLHSLVTSHSHWYAGTFTPQMESVLDRVQSQESFDIVLFEFPMLGQYPLDPRAVRIMDAHNVEYDAMRRMATVQGDPVRKWFYQAEHRKIRKEELEIASRQDALFVTSQRDAELFARDLPHLPRVVIPNGVDSGYYPFRPSLHETGDPQPGDPQPGGPKTGGPKTGGLQTDSPLPFDLPAVRANRLVFTGMMGYVPNYDGVLHFLDEAFPRIRAKIPDAELLVVGKNPPAHLRRRSGDGVKVTGFVQDVRPHVYSAAVYVVPLRMGGGTRLKVLEALSAGIPVVTTPIGCEGIDVVDGEHVLIREEPEAFAEAVLELLSDPELAARLVRNGRRLVEEVYDWRHIGARMDIAFREMLLRRTEREISRWLPAAAGTSLHRPAASGNGRDPRAAPAPQPVVHPSASPSPTPNQEA